MEYSVTREGNWRELVIQAGFLVGKEEFQGTKEMGELVSKLLVGQRHQALSGGRRMIVNQVSLDPFSGRNPSSVRAEACLVQHIDLPLRDAILRYTESASISILSQLKRLFGDYEWLRPSPPQGYPDQAIETEFSENYNEAEVEHRPFGDERYNITNDEAQFN
ncbi:hypothetical protein RUND412_005982 [Rhizina undulata]